MADLTGEYTDKRITLSVAFKEAVGITEVGIDNYLSVVKARTQAFYALQTELADAIIGVRPDRPKGGNPNWKGGSGSGGGTSRRATLPKITLPNYLGDNQPIEFFDQRPAKADGSYKPTAPDFQSVTKFDLKGDGESRNLPIWLVDRDGAYNAEVAEMLTKAGVDLSVSDSPKETAAAPSGSDVF